MGGSATSSAKGRAWRKLLRNRLAIAAMGVIAVYLAVAAASFAGLITRETTQVRVLPDLTPGWIAPRDIEQRINEAAWLAERASGAVEEALESDDLEQAARVLAEAALAERDLADAPLPGLETLAFDALDALDLLDEALFAYEDALDEILTLSQRIERYRERGDGFVDRIDEARAEIEAIEAAVPDLRAEVARRLDVLEARVLDVMPRPEGFDAVVYGLRTSLGSDASGRSIMMKAMFSTRIALQIGLVVAVACVIIGTAFGAAAAFFGGWVDYAVMYVVSVMSSVPSLVLLGVLVFMFQGSAWFDNPAVRPGLALIPVYAAMGLTYWVGTCRVVRGEVMKIKHLEYVQAATSLGFGRLYVLFRHVIPNTAHLMFINFALLFIGAIKSEVILSFLGLGVKGQPSWGIMISQAKDDITVGFFWEVGAASVFMFGLVLAFNVLTDALQDAFDPRHVS